MRRNNGKDAFAQRGGPKTRPKQVKTIVWLGENEKSTKNAVFQVTVCRDSFCSLRLQRCECARSGPAASAGSEGESAPDYAIARRHGSAGNRAPHDGAVRQSGDAAGHRESRDSARYCEGWGGPPGT